jgi:hypothetical protein
VANGGQALLAAVSAPGTSSVTGRIVDLENTSIVLTDVTSTAGDLTLRSSAGRIGIGTATATGGNLLASANGGDVAITSATTTGTTTAATTGTNSVVIGNLTSAGAATLTGPGGVEVAGSSGGDVALLATGGGVTIGTGGLTAANGTIRSTASAATTGGALSAQSLVVQSGSINLDAVTATAGDLTFEATAGDLTVGTAAAIGGNLLASANGGDVAITTATTTGTGTATATGTGSVSFGNLTTGGAMRLTGPGGVSVAGVSGGDATLTTNGTVTIGAGGLTAANGTLRSTASVAMNGGALSGPSLVVRSGSINLEAATATTGDLTLEATSGGLTVGTASAMDGNLLANANGGDVAITTATTRGTATAATDTGSVSFGNLTTGGAMQLTGPGGVSVAGVSGGDAILTTNGTATIGAGGLNAAGRTVRISAGDGAIGGNVAADRIVVTHQAPAGNRLGVGDGLTGAAGFELSQAEFNRLNAPEIILDAGTSTKLTPQDVAIGALAIDADSGASRIDILGLQRLDVTGEISASGGAAPRSIRLGGAAGASERASVIRVATSASGTGGRLALGGSNVELRGTKIGVGQDQGFLAALGLTPGAAPLPSATVQSGFIGNPRSSLYNAQSGTAAAAGLPYAESNRTIVAARTLTIRVGDYALFQNTGLIGSRGVVLGGTAAAPIANVLTVSGPNPPDAAGLAIYGSINGVSDTATALLGSTVIGVTAIDRANARVNGCLIGGGGCLGNAFTLSDIGTFRLSSVPFRSTRDCSDPAGCPTLQVFDTRRLDMLEIPYNFLSPFDPLMGTNNEALFSDIGTAGLDDIPPPDTPAMPIAAIPTDARPKNDGAVVAP